MFIFFFFIRKNEEESFKVIFEKMILSNIMYTKMVFYFEDKNYESEFIENNPLYAIEKYRIDIYNENKMIEDEKYVKAQLKKGFIIENVCNEYNGLVTFITVHKLKNINVEEIVQRMIMSIQKALEKQIYIYSSNKVERKIYNERLIEKVKDYEEKSVYDISIMSIYYNAIWIKKMLFEIKYVNMVENEDEFEYYMSMIYYKYEQVYC